MTRLMVFLMIFSGTAWGQEFAAVVLRPLERPAGGADALAKTLTETWSHQFSAQGFVIVDGTDAHPARFEARGLLVRENGDLVLQVAVTDLPSHSIVASDMIAVYEGLTALEPIKSTLGDVTGKVKAFWTQIQANPPPVPPIQDPLVFLSDDEGTEIFWQGHDSVGKVADGQLTAPYYPFPSNAVLTLTLEKEGYRTKTLDLPLDAGQTEYPLPKLEKLRLEEVHTFVQGGRLLGLGAEYRKYFVPEWAFWSAEAYPFVQYRPDIKGSQPVAHLDLAGSVGTWVFFDADSWFRFGAQMSFGLNQTLTISSKTPGWYLDATVSPLNFTLEWNLWGFIVENRIQGIYSLGLPTGLMGQRWMLIDSMFPLLSVGVVTKW